MLLIEKKIMKFHGGEINFIQVLKFSFYNY